MPPEEERQRERRAVPEQRRHQRVLGRDSLEREVRCLGRSAERKTLIGAGPTAVRPGRAREVEPGRDQDQRSGRTGCARLSGGENQCRGDAAAYGVASDDNR